MTQSIYFAFHDGIFGYDCRTCDALCCKGHGMGAVRDSEVRPLIAKYPSLALFTLRVNEHQTHFETPKDGCFFLQDDRRCRIEVEESRAIKPMVCKTFPFNNNRQLESTLVVRPHFLCPLTIGQGNHRHQASSYAQLEQEYLPYGDLTQDKLNIRALIKPQSSTWLSQERQWLMETDTVVRSPEKSKEWVTNWLSQSLSNEIPLLPDFEEPEVDAINAQMVISLLPSLRLELTHLERSLQDEVLRLVTRLLQKTIVDTTWSPGLQGLNSLYLSLIQQYEWLMYDPTLIRKIVTNSDALPTSKEFRDGSQDALSLGILAHLLQSGVSVGDCIQSLIKDYDSQDYFYHFLGKVGRLYRSESIRLLGKH